MGNRRQWTGKNIITMAPIQRTWRTRKIGSLKPLQRLHAPRQFRVPHKRSGGSFPSRLVLLALIGGIASVVLIAGFFYVYSRDLPAVEEIRKGSIVIPESTKIYDRSSEHLLYTIHGEENRTRISLAEIPDFVKWATIATEDQDFYRRDLAIDFKGIARAILGLLRTHSLESSPGGSTITQQLVKNLILTREKTLSRKIKEIILSFRIEKTFTRDEILELYLNQIPYGSNAYGIEQSSQTFFGKSAKHLTLSQSAILAALPKATTRLSPFGSQTDELFDRQRAILKQMLNEGYISEDEWNRALTEEVAFKKSPERIEAPHFVMYVREILAHRYGDSALEHDGLNVITTLDYDLQKIAEKAVAEGAKTNDQKGADNAGLVAIDPKTGQILAMVGSRDYFDTDHEGNFNVALANRQPGSSFKPIVYATLFTKGYTPDTILYDVETDFDPREGAEYKPQNYDGKFRGPVKIRAALAGSLNIPAVKALYLAGVETVLDYAARLGYTTLTDPGKVGLSLALGGGGVKLLEHTLAFAVLINDGVREETVSIMRVEKNNANVLEEWEESDGERVFSINSARMVIDILQDNSARAQVFGEGGPLVLKNRPAAVKTGTTNDYRDAWTIGGTPQIVAGVWAGNNDNSPMNKGDGGSRAAAPIWNAFMQGALKNTEVIQFPKPEIPVTGKPILDGTLDGAIKVKVDKVSGKLATEYTPAEYIEEQSFAEFHSIFHYIDKSAPLGPAPVQPSLDPQYSEWEKGITLWVEKSGSSDKLTKPPTEYDDAHVPANIPYLAILSPAPRAELHEDSVLVEIDVTAKRHLAKVEYELDGQFRESAGLLPYSRRVYFGSIPDGAHIITVTAFDDAGNRAKQEVEIALSRGKSAGETSPLIPATPGVTILAPTKDAVIARDQFPFTVRLFVDKSELAELVNVYYNDKNGNPMLIGTVTSIAEEPIGVSWRTSPPSGPYTMYAILIDKNGESYRSEVKIIVN